LDPEPLRALELELFVRVPKQAMPNQPG